MHSADDGCNRNTRLQATRCVWSHQRHVRIRFSVAFFSFWCCSRLVTTGAVDRVRANIFQNAHVDVGLITAAPLSAQSGLQLLQQVPLADGSQRYRWEWVGVEATHRTQASEEGQGWIVFSGEVLGVITGNGTFRHQLPNFHFAYASNPLFTSVL